MKGAYDILMDKNIEYFKYICDSVNEVKLKFTHAFNGRSSKLELLTDEDLFKAKEEGNKAIKESITILNSYSIQKIKKLNSDELDKLSTKVNVNIAYVDHVIRMLKG